MKKAIVLLCLCVCSVLPVMGAERTVWGFSHLTPPSPQRASVVETPSTGISGGPKAKRSLLNIMSFGLLGRSLAKDKPGQNRAPGLAMGSPANSAASVPTQQVMSPSSAAVGASSRVIAADGVKPQSAATPPAAALEQRAVATGSSASLATTVTLP